MATNSNAAADMSGGPNIPNRTRFADLVKNEDEAIFDLQKDLGDLEARKAKVSKLGEADAEEYKRLSELKALSDGPASHWIKFDPLFVALREALGRADGNLAVVRVFHANGALGFDPAPDDDDENNRQIVRVSLLYGMLASGKAALPPVVAAKDRTLPMLKHPNWNKFLGSFYATLGRISGQMGLAQKVLSIIINDLRINSRQVAEVYASQFAEVMNVLIDKGVDQDDSQLKPVVQQVLDRTSEFGKGGGEDTPLHEIAIDLPDLNAWVDTNILAENVYLMGPMIFASMFEELKAFQVVDKLVELSQRGQISLTKGKAGTQLYEYWRQAPNRMSEVERQTFYAMTLGMPTGQPSAQVNGEFQDLWIRFVSSVSSLVRENRVDQLIRSSLPVAINQQQVKKSARDLLSNMSLYGYGMAYYAAIDLQKQINEMISLLSDPEIRGNFGARDMWGVIDQIAQVELGGARNSSKYRTLATSGAIITRWLGDNIPRLSDPTLPALDLKDVENPPARRIGQSATSNPTDYDLVNACELWLADSAMDDTRIEEFSQPRESPAQPSRPIQMPSIARDLLEGTGLGLGMGHQPAANGYAHSPYAGY